MDYQNLTAVWVINTYILTKKNFNLMPLLESIEKHFNIIKTNTVVIKDVNDDEVIDIINHMKNFKSEIRFIEYMDVGESNKWDPSKVVSSESLLESINEHYSLKQQQKNGILKIVILQLD